MMNRKRLTQVFSIGCILLYSTAIYAASLSPGYLVQEQKSVMPEYYTIPVIDISRESHRQVIVDREAGQYLGHPTTVLLEDGKTMIAVYPKGHGGGAIVMKRSTDAGLTWSKRLATPKSWATSKEVPTIHRVIDKKGKKRLIMFSGLYPIRMAVSEDDGKSWSELEPIGDFGGIVAMASVVRLTNGDYMALFHDDGRFLKGQGKPTKIQVFKIISKDGGLTWFEPVVIAEHAEAHLCEPGVIRSPDGKQLAMLLRENSRKFNSFLCFSDDEGKTWSKPRELPASLTGDRHTGRYAPDGRLFITFRDTTRQSATQGDWVGWVGTYDDIVNNTQGQYRIRIMDNHRAWDCAYPGLEILGDGTFVTTTYGHWTQGQQPYIVSIRFKLDEIDALAEKPSKRTVLFQQGKGGYNKYRIPSLIVSKKGTLLAFCEGREGGDAGDIDIMLRRSEDGGRTWTQKQVVWSDARNTCGNPCPVVDRDTGRIWLMTTWNLGTDHEGDIITWKSKDVRRPYVCYSDDDGKTWATPVNISKTARREDWRWYATGPGNGIQIRKGRHKGRLVIPANHSYDETRTDVYRRSGKYGYGSHVIYSDDHGENWKLSESITPGCNESTIAELSDGRLMMNMRSYNARKCRAISISGDGGATWSPIEHDQVLIEPVCQASLISYRGKDDDKNLLIFSNPANKSGRSKLTVRISYDDGKTWPVAKLLHAAPAAYSCLTVLPDGDIACFHEGGKKSPYETIIFQAFPLEWLTANR